MNKLLQSCLLFMFVLQGLAEKDVLEPKVLPKDKAASSKTPMEFPLKSDSSTPIVVGTDPKSSKLPPKVFPTESSNHDSTGPPIRSVSDTRNTKTTIQEIKPHPEVEAGASENQNATSTVNSTKPIIPDKPSGEQYDMRHSRYKGGMDVDEILKPDKKASEEGEKKVFVKDDKKTIEKDDKKTEAKDEKKEDANTEKLAPAKDPKSEVLVDANMDKKGPKFMNESKKTGESVLESTSKIMVVSSSVLSNTKPKHGGIIDPIKTVISVILSATFIVGLGIIGLLVWKRISMRRFGRDVLINEDDFDDISDMHTFDGAQIQIT